LAFAAPGDLGTAVAKVPPDSPMRLEALLESVLEGVWTTGTVWAEAEAECARCLKDLRLDLEATFQELFVYPEQAGQDQAEVADDQVDLAPAVRDAIVLGLPFQPLCRKDCPGLCLECGQDLAEAPDHAHTRLDPRWALLEDLLEDEREEK
jgi:uncharacterized protein